MPQFNSNNFDKSVTKWSASRISTFRSCPLKYYYTYVQKWICSKPANDEAARKGTCFHETVEHYYTGMPKEELHKILDEKLEEYNIDETVYHEHDALERFFLFWENRIASKEKEGYKMQQEGWANGELGGEHFFGALDLRVVNDSNGKIEIYDYKSGKTPSISKYKDQLMLYSFLLGQEHGWDFKETAENIKLYLFFPLSVQEKPITAEDKMLASIKEIKYTPEMLEECINEYLTTINDIQNQDWSDLDSLGNYQFLCNWCEHCGGNPNADGYKGCKASRDAGFHQERGVTYTLKEKVKLQETKTETPKVQERVISR